MASTISTIVCVDRDLRFLSQALDSIVGQSHPVDEIIVIRSAATPETLRDILRPYPVARIERQTEPGLAAARNQGVNGAVGDRITFLDADDRWLPDKTERQLAVIEARGVPVVGRLRRFQEDRGPGEEAGTPSADDLQTAMTPGALMIDRDAFDTIGPFNARYRLACDHDWFVRLRRSALSPHVIEDVVLEKRMHDGNLSNDRDAYRRELLDMLRSDRGD